MGHETLRANRKRERVILPACGGEREQREIVVPRTHHARREQGAAAACVEIEMFDALHHGKIARIFRDRFEHRQHVRARAGAFDAVEDRTRSERIA
jgi:hypothetical protein